MLLSSYQGIDRKACISLCSKSDIHSLSIEEILI